MELHQTSPQSLAKAAAAAAIVAAAVLTLFVLPAEYGVDPTGVGSSLGLTAMSKAPEETEQAGPPAASPTSAASVPAAAIPDKGAILKTAKWRNDETTLTLAPDEGTEVKAHMNAGDHFVFRWEAKGGPVKLDMHGEATGAGEDEFSSYWEEPALTEGQGSFTAPFTGTHGWYWRNRGDAPVTVTVKTVGFYADLFRPSGD